MKIGIIGSGAVGQSLAKGFLKYGYSVMMGTSDKAKHDDLKKKTGVSSVGSFEDAARFGELLVLACKATAVESVLKAAGVDHFKGKTVIDANNPISDEAPTKGVLHYFTTLEESLMERLQRLAPEAHFVKAFSCIGNAFMVNPDFGGVKPTMFICGNNEGAKKQVTKILDQFGFETEDMGTVEAARAIEPLCLLWCLPGFLRNQWTHAFKLLKK